MGSWAQSLGGSEETGVATTSITSVRPAGDRGEERGEAAVAVEDGRRKNWATKPTSPVKTTSRAAKRVAKTAARATKPARMRRRMLTAGNTPPVSGSCNSPGDYGAESMALRCGSAGNQIVLGSGSLWFANTMDRVLVAGRLPNHLFRFGHRPRPLRATAPAASLVAVATIRDRERNGGAGKFRACGWSSRLAGGEIRGNFSGAGGVQSCSGGGTALKAMVWKTSTGTRSLPTSAGWNSQWM